MDLSPKRSGGQDQNSIEVWAESFQTHYSGYGMICQVCSALVAQGPGHAKRHLEWHQQIGDGDPA